ncbi:microsomal glutathione S-transferase 1-like [Lycorma delicatula]|uniref:microsomal glutathione S-transferase 1-like n=1 Tax=Lycorma delicatula TaxID=130591 RepID=UPI003F515F5D
MYLLSWENAAFSGFAFYSIILMVKMFILAIYTGILRFKKQVYINSEDAAAAGVDIKKDDPDVERIRRAHQNDLENFPIFFMSGIIFILADPNAVFALMMFRFYAIARIVHTVAYCCLHVRSVRSISFFIGVLINLIMIITALITFHQM